MLELATVSVNALKYSEFSSETSVVSKTISAFFFLWVKLEAQKFEILRFHIWE